MSGRIYLDYNATAPTRAEAREAMADALAMHGNPSSVHEEGRRMRAAVEQAREKVAALLGAEPKQVIFTSGGTEANVTALAPQNVDRDASDRVVCFLSEVEHPSVLAAGRFQLDSVRMIGATQDGVIDTQALKREIERHTERNGAGSFMVSLMRANNETGALQPVAEVAALVRKHGGILHCDAVQAAGKVPVDINSLGAHFASLSAHKIGGPHGVGALILGDGMANLPSPLIVGGGQELRARSGTENVVGIVGFGAAAECAAKELKKMAELAGLRDHLEAEIARRSPSAVFFSKNVERLPNTSNFAVPGMKSDTTVIGLDLSGFAVSAGSSCSSGKVEQSHVLLAMQADPEAARCAIRVSLGCQTRQEDIEAFLTAWGTLHENFLQQRNAA